MPDQSPDKPTEAIADARMRWIDSKHISTVETAALIRKALRRQFPSVRFSVRSQSGSVDVRWEGGPREDDVRQIAEQFEGGCGDGDYNPRPVFHYFFPDGHTEVAYISPSQEIGAMEPQGVDNQSRQERLSRDVELVHFDTHYVSCHRGFA